MSLKFCLLGTFFISLNLWSQELPHNPKTGLISILDSVEIYDATFQELKDAVKNWGFTLLDQDNLSKIYKLDNSKQTEKVAINLPIGSVLTIDKGAYRFVTSGTLGYQRIKTKGIPSATFGTVKFDFIYSISGKWLVYEFTNLEYSHDGVHYGKFEGDKPPSDNYNGSFILKMSKREWVVVKAEYYENLKILGSNFHEYLSNTSGGSHANNLNTQVTYETYKKIIIGMPLGEITKLFKEEGRELNNSAKEVNRKTVTQQTIIWSNPNGSKSITVVFSDGKVTSKSQSNL